MLKQTTANYSRLLFNPAFASFLFSFVFVLFCLFFFVFCVVLFVFLFVSDKKNQVLRNYHSFVQNITTEKTIESVKKKKKKKS